MVPDYNGTGILAKKAPAALGMAGIAIEYRTLLAAWGGAGCSGRCPGRCISSVGVHASEGYRDSRHAKDSTRDRVAAAPAL